MLEVFQVVLLWVFRQIWQSLPLLTIIAGTLAMMAPMNLMPSWLPTPDLILIGVFFWAISGPAFLPAWAVLLLGLMQDLLTGTPPGFWALIYLLSYGFTLSQRVFFMGRTGLGAWIGFALVAGLAAVATWILGSIVYTQWLPPSQIWMQAIVSVICYGPVAKVFGLMRRTLTTAREGL